MGSSLYMGFTNMPMSIISATANTYHFGTESDLRQTHDMAILR